MPGSNATHANGVARPPALYVRTVRGMGRGVFAGRRFRTGEVIEVCPVVLIPEAMERKCRGEGLERYIFAWNTAGDVAAIALGYGSLYNHADDPNAGFAARKKDKVVVFRARRDIAKGEQIFVDYEWEATDYHFPTPAVPDEPSGEGRTPARPSPRRKKTPTTPGSV